MNFMDFFKDIAKTPHCSFDTKELKNLLENFAKEQNFALNIDEFGNIHAKKGKPKICLQAHYDMVCVGNAPKIELINDGKFISAKNSTLGADNGIGVAIIMEMMALCNEKNADLEVLFTNDEEVGLVGASGFKGEIEAQNLLNLDSECDEEVIIGCAGGLNAKISKNFELEECCDNVYEVLCEGLPGGHSGIEIHKDIPNAIIKVASFLRQNECNIISFEGGHRNNAIPVSARAIVNSKNELKSTELIKVKKLNIKKNIIKNSKNLLNFILALPHGVLGFESELGIVKTSINLAILNINTANADKNKLSNEKSADFCVELYARSSDEGELKALYERLEAFSELINAQISANECSAPWQPVQSKFALDTLTALKKYKSNAKLNVIHAGLECGVLCANSKKALNACSIGPNIAGAHTISESCDIKSAEMIRDVVREILGY